MKKADEVRKVTVYDAIMGSGKTYDAIERMKRYIKCGKRFIYVTPFLDEGERIINALPKDSIYKPLSRKDNNGKGVYEAQCKLTDDNGMINLNAKTTYTYLNKRAQFLKLASEKKNIVSTHALFLDLKKEDFSLFKDYILILDEVVTPLKVENIGARDIQILKNQELIVINDDTNKVTFIEEDYLDNAFKVVKKLCNNNSVYFLDKYYFAWIFPIEIFKEFKEVQILTYLFEGSLLAAYFKIYNLSYILIKKESIEGLLKFKELLNIYEGKANQLNGSNTHYSKTWQDNLSKVRARKITDSTSNLFKRVFKTTSAENAYTTFKSFKTKFAGKGYTKGFIAINERATNKYRHKKSMAYIGNRYFDPQTLSFFNERGIKLNTDLWALSELLQWLWRGCIRDNKKMNLYIPSKRMRNLLIDWLNGEFISSKIEYKKTA